MTISDSDPKTEYACKSSVLRTVLVFAAVYVVFDLLLVVVLLVLGGNIFHLIGLVYISNMVLLPIIALSYSMVNIVRRKDRTANYLSLFMAAALLGVFVYATFIEPNFLKVNEYKIITDKLKGQVVVVHISDIQSAGIGAYEKKVFGKLRQLNPDVILHTGDLIQIPDYITQMAEVEKLGRLFKGLTPKYGIYNVAGNIDSGEIISFLDSVSGVKTLINESEVINGDDFQISLLGLSFDQSSAGGRQKISQWLNENESNITILMGHSPDYVLDITDLSVDLCLAGHTHGGQVDIPFFGPLLTASRIPRNWASGFRKINNLHLNVTSGIGVEHVANVPPIRFNCRPSISVIRIVGGNSGVYSLEDKKTP